MAIDIGELRGIISLQDQFSGPANEVAKGVGLMSESFGAITGLVGLATSAVVSAGAAIVALGTYGAGVADVRGSFEELSLAAGESADVMLGALNKGTLGTISNFDLMQKANSVLGSGMIKSAADMGTLAAGAKLLGDRTGKDTSKALDILTDSIEKGRTAGLKQLGVFVDNATAVDQYAQKIGKSVGDLNDQEKAQALSAATLAALRGELEKAGPATADFGDMIDRGKVVLKNFTDDMSVAIAASPVLGAGLQAIGQAVELAFGGDQSQLVKTIMGYVESFAIGLTHAADIGVDVAGVLTFAWNGLKLVFAVFMAGWTAQLGLIASGIATLAETATKLPGVGDKFKGIADEARGAANNLTAMRDSYVEQAKEIVDGADTQREAFDKAHGVIKTVRDAMIEAGKAGGELKTGADVGASGVKAAGEAAALTADQLKKIEDQARKSADAFVESQQLIADKNLELQDRMALDTETGLARQLLAIEQKKNAELATIQFIAFEAPAQYEAMAAKIAAIYGKLSGDAVTSYANQANAATACALTQEERARAALDKAVGYLHDLEASDKATGENIQTARANVAKATQALDDAVQKNRLDQLTTLASAASSILRSIFGKNKAAAIAAAVIDTAAAVAKALAAYPWPWSLVPAAAAAAAGYAQVSAIRNQNADGFAEGTPGTSFLDFGRGSLEMLHGREAVVTEAQGSSLAGMMGEAIRSAQGGDPAMLREMRMLNANFANLPQMLGIAMRDGVLMAV